jgi:hypothetical protein
MRRKRPTAVLVMAILNMVWGGIWVACYLCIGVLALFVVAVVNQPGAAAKGDAQKFKEVFGSMSREMPGLVALAVGEIVVRFLLAALLIIAGIGLLGVRQWARVASIFYAVATILVMIASLVVTFGYLNPRMEKWQRDFAARHGQVVQQRPENPLAQGAGAAVGVVLNVGYSIALLVVLFLPHVSAAFAEGRRPDYEEDRGAEDEDLGYERGRGGGWGDEP